MEGRSGSRDRNRAWGCSACYITILSHFSIRPHILHHSESQLTSVTEHSQDFGEDDYKKLGSKFWLTVVINLFFQVRTLKRLNISLKMLIKYNILHKCIHTIIQLCSAFNLKSLCSWHIGRKMGCSVITLPNRCFDVTLQTTEPLWWPSVTTE